MPLIVIGIPYIAFRIELLRESRLSARSCAGGNVGKTKVEEITRQRIALIVDVVAPGIRALQVSPAPAIARHSKRVVISKIPGSPDS